MTASLDPVGSTLNTRTPKHGRVDEDSYSSATPFSFSQLAADFLSLVDLCLCADDRMYPSSMILTVALVSS